MRKDDFTPLKNLFRPTDELSSKYQVQICMVRIQIFTCIILIQIYVYNGYID